MLNKIREQFYSILPTEDWMEPADRKAAQEKLMAMFFQVSSLYSGSVNALLRLY
jgi:hypothetical protein